MSLLNQTRIWKGILLLLIIVAVFFRLYRFGGVPPGVNRDEAALGYNAYSILMTGKDEYGKILPFSFESFGDWKLPGYIYLSTIPIKIFGMGDFSVRLVSLLSGMATVILTFFIAEEVFKNKAISLLSVFFIALSPWHIFFSRVASEANTAVFFGTLGFFLFLKALKGRKIFFVPAFFLLGLTLFIYAGEHVFTSLLFVSLFVLFVKNNRNKYFFIGSVIFMLCVLIVGYFTFFSADRTKISGTGIFGDPTIVYTKIDLPRELEPSLIGKLLYNKPLYFLESFSHNYLESFSPDFLFVKGGTNSQHNIKNFGNMYLLECLFFLIGFFLLILKKRNKEALVILIWILISPIAPSITKDAPHSSRMFSIFPALPIVTAYGANEILNILKNKRKGLLWIILFAGGAIYALNIIFFIDRYFVQFPINEVESWGNSYKQLSAIFNNPENRDKRIVMTHPEDSPYIYFLFYDKYSPKLFQKDEVRYPKTSEGFRDVKSFGRFEFRNIEWKKDFKLKNYIMVDKTTDIPYYIKNRYRVEKIFLPNGVSEFSLVYL